MEFFVLCIFARLGNNYDCRFYNTVTICLIIQSILGNGMAMYVIFDLFENGFKTKFGKIFPRFPIKVAAKVGEKSLLADYKSDDIRCSASFSCSSRIWWCSSCPISTSCAPWWASQPELSALSSIRQSSSWSASGMIGRYRWLESKVDDIHATATRSWIWKGK